MPKKLSARHSNNTSINTSNNRLKFESRKHEINYADRKANHNLEIK